LKPKREKQAPPIDLIVHHGQIVTCDRDERIASAVAVAHGRIVAVGSEEEIGKLGGSETRFVNLNGASVTPGLIDTHVHTAMAGRRMTDELDLASAKSIAEIVELVKKSASGRPAGEWIAGSGWLETSLKEGRALERDDLDPVAPNNPVLLIHATGHLACVNRLALEMSGITDDSPDPPQGRIERSHAGTPTGILHESAMQLVMNRVPAPTIATWKTAIQEAGKVLAREGVTATKETYPRRDYPNILAAYRELGVEGRLPHRPLVLCQAETLEDIDAYETIASAVVENSHSHRPVPSLGGIKLFLDGSLVAQTAWMNAPYPPAPDGSDRGCGFPSMPPETFQRLALEADRRGLPVSVHAIGDRAVDMTLETFGAMRGNHRPSLIHALVPSEDAFARLRNLSVSVETQPTFLYVLGAGYQRAFDPARLKRLLPLRRMLEAQLLLSFGSDWPTCPPSPRLGMWAACCRQSSALAPEIGTHVPDQRITVNDALRAYTIAAARALGKEAEIGSIEPGKLADFVVWEGNILATPPEELIHLGIRQTMVAGNIIFDSTTLAN